MTGKAVVFLFFMSFGVLYAGNNDITNLTLKKTEGYKISIGWMADTETGTFLIYRNKLKPISSLSIISNSSNIAVLTGAGTLTNNFYQFPEYVDAVDEDGKYYYSVLMDKTNLSDKDFTPDQNYNTIPFIIYKEDFMPPEDLDANYLTVKNIFIKTNFGTIFVFWDMDTQETSNNFIFSIYRTTNRLFDDSQLTNIRPYQIIQNEYYLEDKDFMFGIPYFYTVIVNNVKKLFPGKNQNIEPVIIGSSNTIIKIDREILYSTNISKSEFEKSLK